VASGLEVAASGLEAPTTTGECRRAWLPAATMEGGARRKRCVTAWGNESFWAGRLGTEGGEEGRGARGV
jgi:hypothetical protein